MRSPRLLSLLVGLVVMLAAASVRAQQPTDADLEAAEIHFKAGEQYYERGRYREGILEFEEAYRLTKLADLLFNISNSYERLGELPKAREYLQRYIDSGEIDESELPAIKDKLRVLDERIAQAKKGPEIKPPERTVVVETSARPFKLLKWIAVGGGVGLLAASTIFMLDAKSMNKKIEDAAAPDGAPPNDINFFDEDLEAAYARGQRDDVLAWACGLTGVALVGTGVVFFLLDMRTERVERVSIVPVVSPQLTGATAIIRF
jgi:tetratricopeptide (TPR) repeat protein